MSYGNNETRRLSYELAHYDVRELLLVSMFIIPFAPLPFSSCDPPALDALDSPLPLEATPLPLFSPKLAVFENVLENGLAPCSNEEQQEQQQEQQQQQQQQEQESTELALKEDQLLPLPSLPDVGTVLTEAIPIDISAITQPPEAELLATKSPEETK